MVGTCGSAGDRVSPLTASGRTDPGLDERHHAGNRAEEELGVARDGGGHRRATAPERHVDGVVLDAGQCDEHGDREVAGRSGPAGGVVELAGLGFGERDQLLDGRGRKLGIHHQQVLHQRNQRDRLEVLDRVVAQLGGDHRREGMRGHRAREQRVAIRLGVGGGFRSDLAAGAAAIVDDDRRVEDGGHFRGNDTDDGVVGAAGRIGGDHPDRPVGIALGGRRLNKRRDAEQKRKPGRPDHSVFSPDHALRHHRQDVIGPASWHWPG